MDIQELLITILQDKYMGVGAIPNVAEAIAANARFNIWFLTYAKKEASEGQLLELLDRQHAITERCFSLVKKFNEDHDLSRLMTGIDDLTKELNEAKKLP